MSKSRWESLDSLGVPQNLRSVWTLQLIASFVWFLCRKIVFIMLRIKYLDEVICAEWWVKTYPFHYATSAFLSFTCKNDPRPTENLWQHSNYERAKVCSVVRTNFSPNRVSFGSITLLTLLLSESRQQKKNMPQSLFGKIDFDFNQSNFIMVFLISFFPLDFNISHFNIIFFFLSRLVPSRNT
jgi:hypothetical protein